MKPAGVLALRAGGVRDIDAVQRIMDEAFDPRFGEAWTRNQVIGILAMPGVWLTLAERDGSTVGFALLRAVVDEAELLLLAVSPVARRRGVGGGLVRSAIMDCADRGITAIHLEVRDGNDALKLYTASGFHKIGERRNYYRGVDGRSYSALTLHRPIR